MVVGGVCGLLGGAEPPPASALAPKLGRLAPAEGHEELSRCVETRRHHDPREIVRDGIERDPRPALGGEHCGVGPGPAMRRVPAGSEEPRARRRTHHEPWALPVTADHAPKSTRSAPRCRHSGTRRCWPGRELPRARRDRGRTSPPERRVGQCSTRKPPRTERVPGYPPPGEPTGPAGAGCVLPGETAA